jgi:hypothetical protein
MFSSNVYDNSGLANIAMPGLKDQKSNTSKKDNPFSTGNIFAKQGGAAVVPKPNIFAQSSF